MRAIPMAGAAVTAVIVAALGAWYLTFDAGKSHSIAQTPTVLPPAQVAVIAPDLSAPVRGTSRASKTAWHFSSRSLNATDRFEPTKRTRQSAI